MTASLESIRILIVDDSAIVRHGIRSALEREPNATHLQVVGEAATAAAALIEAVRLQPEIVLLDLRLPDASGVDVCRQLREKLPETVVLVFTSSTDNRSVYQAIVAGAHGYLLKEIDPAALVRAIEDAHAGRPVFSPDVSSRMIEIVREGHTGVAHGAALATLSNQEQRVLAAMSAGDSNKDIAARLGLSENTVKNYIGRLFEKLGVQRRSQAVALFLGWNPPPGSR